MKLKKTVLPLTMLFLLAGCQGNTDSDNGKPTESHPYTDINNSSMFDTGSVKPDTGTSENPFSYTADDLYRLLNKAGEETNFTFTYSVSDDDGTVSYDDSYTDSYIYFGYGDAGYLTVSDYADKTKTLLYNYTMKDGTPDVENALAYNDENGNRIAIRETKEMNPLNGMLTGKDSSVFVPKSRSFYTEDSQVITALCYLRGITSLVGEVKGVELEVNKDFDEFINFRFAPNFSTTDGADKLDTVGVCSISLIGNTEEPELKDFQASYSLPSTALSDTILSSLDGKVSLSAVNTMHYTTDYVYERYDVVTDATRQQYSRYVAGIENPEQTYLYQGENGNAYEEYVSYENKLVEKDLGNAFTKEVIQPKDTIEASAFRKSADSTYTYYGYDGRNFIQKLTKIDMGEVLSITLTVTGEKISSLKAISTTRLDSYTQSMYFELNVDFNGTMDFTKPKTYSSSYSDAEMATMLLYPQYSDLTASFSAKISTVDSASYPLSVSVFSSKGDSNIDTILYTQQYIDPAPGAYQEVLTKKWGYYKSGSDSTAEIIPFSVRDDNTTVSTSLSIKNKNLKDFIGFDLNGALFDDSSKKTDGSNHVFSLYPFVKDISDHVLGGDYKEDLIPSSLRFTVNDTFYPVKLEYEFNGYDLFKGKEQVVFSDWYSTTKPADIDFSTLKPFVEPDNWQDGAPEVYPTMVKVLGDVIKEVPYLYNKEMAGNWGIDANEDYKYVVVFNDTYSASEEKDDKSFAYMKSFEELLRKKGYTDGTYPLDGAACLKKGNLCIRVGDRGMAGIRFMIDDGTNYH